MMSDAQLDIGAPPMRHDLTEVRTRLELVAVVIAAARKEGRDEIETIDRLLSSCNWHREDVRAVAQELQSMAYSIQIIDYLRARARRLPSRPPPKWPRRADLPNHIYRRGLCCAPPQRSN
jgi:hypothetical protein